MTRQNAEHGGGFAAPTTDCPICGRTAKDCNDSHAKGWDGCCQGCDGAGRVNTHRLRLVTPSAPTHADEGGA